MKLIKFALVALLAATAGSANARTAYTAWGHITVLTEGWTQPHLRIELDVPFSNPDGCASTDGYLLAYDLPANQQITAMAMTAYSAKQRVQLTISGCYLDRPSIIGFSMKE
jgi:hypothetical protein